MPEVRCAEGTPVFQRLLAGNALQVSEGVDVSRIYAWATDGYATDESRARAHDPSVDNPKRMSPTFARTTFARTTFARTTFGFVHEGRATLVCAAGTFCLREGMYFSVFGDFSISGGGGVLITAPSTYRGFFMVGGPIEERGRLRYIDGCTDSLLIAPIRLGDPCLNLLHLPAATDQSAHTHPSYRLGLVIAGEGQCITERAQHAIVAGEMFCIPADCLHRFKTTAQSLLVLAFHPDSDIGPTDENHPMINRTIIDSPCAKAEKCDA